MVNRRILELEDSYLFTEVARRTADFRKKTGREVIRLSIGDVTRPLPPVCIEAMHRAVEKLAHAETFTGYSPDPVHGTEELNASIRRHYAQLGIGLEREEVFVSDGAKSDLKNLPEIFSEKIAVLIPDPVYPVYIDTNVMAGRTIVYADAVRENRFLPMPDGGTDADLIYLCSPGNPTGAAYTVEQLQKWVDYANGRGAVILFDSAYERYVTQKGIARSIYEAKGAEKCAVEIGSFSKTAGFTGVRCGYTIVPKALEREGISLNRLWGRRQSCGFNGASCIAQAGAAAVFTEEGERQVQEILSYYRENARTICALLDSLGIFYSGGIDSPYIFMQCPRSMKSRDFFEQLLSCGVAGTPGSGFGKNGEGYFRLTAFGTHEDTREACARMRTLLC